MKIIRTIKYFVNGSLILESLVASTILIIVFSLSLSCLSSFNLSHMPATEDILECEQVINDIIEQFAEHALAHGSAAEYTRKLIVSYDVRQHDIAGMDYLTIKVRNNKEKHVATISKLRLNDDLL